MRIKIKIVFLFFFINVNNLFAQDWEKSSEVCLGYGLFSHQYLTVVGQDISVLGPSKGKIKDSKSSGSISLCYRYFTGNRFSIGAGIAFEHFSGTTDNYYDWKRTVFNVVPEASYIYKEISLLKLYGLAGIGVSYQIDKVNRTSISTGSLYNGNGNKLNFSWQISPIGLRVGKKAGGYIEAGYGYKGIINLGFSLKL